jgi:hypothetical protein
MFLAQRNHEIQTLPAYASHQPFAVGVRLWRSRGRLQYPQSKSLELLVHFCREDRITVPDQETVGMVARDRFAQLLQGPGCRWMRGDVAMHNAPCADLHQEEHIESLEPRGHHDQEIAGGDGLGMTRESRGSSSASQAPFAACALAEGLGRGGLESNHTYAAVDNRIRANGASLAAGTFSLS